MSAGHHAPQHQLSGPADLFASSEWATQATPMVIEEPLVRLWSRIQSAEDALAKLAQLQVDGAGSEAPTLQVNSCVPACTCSIRTAHHHQALAVLQLLARTLTLAG